ncbi:MAG TPA: hypothetical protein VMW79_10595, partial [Anaerolineae bacterium]|nr:hypothetical protein [Anaerolineae bacterium]
MRHLRSSRSSLVAVMLVGMLLLSACGTPAPTAPTAAPPEAPTAAPTTPPTPVPTPAPTGPTGSLTVALSTYAEDTFLPWNGGVARQTYMGLIYEWLFYTNVETL